MEDKELLLHYFSLKVNAEYHYLDKLVTKDEFSGISVSELDNILIDINSYNIVAPMNSGKTFSILKLSHLRRIPTIMCVPLTALGSQIKDRFELTNINIEDRNGEEPIPIFFVHGKDTTGNLPGTSDAEIITFCQSVDAFCIVCVYDSLSKLIQNPLMISLLKQYNLIIDESHNLVTQAEFRYTAINSIVKHIGEFRKVIYLSGTPEMTILNEHPVVRFVPKQSEKKSNKVNIIIYEKEPLHKIVSYINSSKNDGKSVILCDNIKMLGEIKKALIHHGIEEDKLLILTRHEKYSEEFISTMREEMIPEKVKFLLATRVISDGINLFNENIERVYFLMVDDVYLKRQFIGRFRNANPDVFDFVNLLESHHPETFQLYEIENQQISLDNSKCSILNNIPYSSAIRSEFQRARVQYSIKNQSNTIIYDDEFKVARERHRKKTLNFLSEYLHSNADHLKTFYEEICGMPCVANEYETLKQTNIIEEKYTEQEFKELMSQKTCLDLKKEENIIEHFNELFSAYIFSKKGQIHEYADTRFIITHFNNDFIEVNKSLFTSEADVFSKCIELLNSGLSWSFVKEYFRLYYANDQSGKVQLNNFFQTLLIYLDYCCFSRLETLKAIVIHSEINILSSCAAINAIIGIKLGVENKSEVTSFVKNACQNAGIPVNQNTSNNYLTALFEYSEYKSTKPSDRKLKIKLQRLRDDSDSTLFFDHFAICNKMDQWVLNHTIDKWYKSTIVRGYHLLKPLNPDMLQNPDLLIPFLELKTELALMCEGALKYD